MHDSLQESVEIYLSKRRSRKVFRKFIRILSGIVAFVTTYALILPAITLEQTTYCDMDDHTHEASCYQMQIEEYHMICTIDAELHVHLQECYGEDGSLICGQADYIIHSHNSFCRNNAGELICTLPECPPHDHDVTCYTTPEPVPHVHDERCLVDVRGDLTCTEEISEGHSHSDQCYQVTSELLCTKVDGHLHDEACYVRQLSCATSTDPHAHSDLCYTIVAQICNIPENHVHQNGCMESYLACNQTESDHIHNEQCDESLQSCADVHQHADACYGTRTICTIPAGHNHVSSCYETLLTCGKAEGEVHYHAESCYSDQKVQNCSLEENHFHGNDCYRKELECLIPESDGHDHDDACYDWKQENGCGMEAGDPEEAEPVLICIEPVASSHDHDRDCLEIQLVDAEPICNETHEHTHTCYDLTCTLQEHTHSLQCYSNPDADVESQKAWEATMNQVQLTGDWHLDVVAIAGSQLGYTESERNYEVQEDQSLHGYTRYGDWYGVPYGDWCAMFASFCLHYAEVEGMPYHCGVRPWIEQLSDPELDLYRSAGNYTPIPGDLVFFDWDEDGRSDHVGIVYEIINETETEPAKLKTIEGNSSNCVQICTYDLDDERLLGYSMLPEKPTQEVQEEETPEEVLPSLMDILICGTTFHTHEESCMDEAGVLLCQQPEHTHTMDCVDSSSPVGYAQSAAAMMYARFAMRTEVQTQYHSDITPLLGNIVIVDTNGNTIYDSSITPEDTIDITLGDTYDVHLTFVETSANQFGTKQLYYQIPSYLATTNVNNGVIRDGEGFLVAVYTIYNNVLTVTPVGEKNFFEVHNDARFAIDLTAEAVFDAEHGELHIDFNDNYKVTINPKENGTLETSKKLVSYDPLTRTLTYKCTTTASGGTIDIVSIADYWYAGETVQKSDVDIPMESVILTDSEGNDVTNQWYIGINERKDLWIVPIGSYSLKHDEFITLTYQVKLSDRLSQNIIFENTYDTYGTFESTGVYDDTVSRDPITFTNITKDGTYVTEYVDGVAVNGLEWTVKILNPDLNAIVITDQLGGVQTFCQHQPIVIKAKVPNTGAVEEITVAWNSIATYANNTQFVMTLPQGYTEYELLYRSHYVLDENGPGIQQFDNTVTTNITIGDVPTSGTASVGVLKEPPRINKQITVADDDWLTFSIDCFMPGALYGQTAVHLYDTLASWGAVNGYVNQEPDSLAVTITPMDGEAYQLQPYPGQGSPENTYLVTYAGQSFTMFFNTDVANTANSVWLCDTDAMLTISYRVAMDSVMLDGWEGNPTEETLYQFLRRTGQNLNNTAQLNYSPNDVIHASAQYTLPKEKAPPLKKSGVPVENQDGVFAYSVWFSSGENESTIFPLIQNEYNIYLNDVNDLELTDTFDPRFDYVDGSFTAILRSYWNHDVQILNFAFKEGSGPTLVTGPDGATVLTVNASDLVALEGTTMQNFEWLTGKSLLEVMQNLAAGYQYEFNYRLRVKDEVKNTSIVDTLHLDNTAELTWTQTDGPQTTGPVDFEVTYDTGILQKSMGRIDGDSNNLQFTVLINDKGLDLSPSDTYILHDTMTPNLMLIYTSLEIEFLDANGRVTEFRTPEQCGFTYNPDLNRMTFVLPDSQVIRLSYNCRVNGDGGNEVDVGNVVVLEGYSEIQDMVNTRFDIRDHIGSADASSKSFVLQKQDAYNFAVLPGVSFELYGDTERSGSKTITVDGKKLWYYATFTTDENGMVNIAESQLSAEHLYALRELEPPPGYTPQEKPYLFYMVYPPKGVDTDIDSIAEGALVVIKNYPLTYSLPDTGGIGTHLFVAGGLAICLLTIFLFYLKRRREVLNSS